MSKLVVLKTLVALQVIQSLILNALSQAHVLKPTRTMSYNDQALGINALLICLESAVFAVLFIPFFSPRAYATRTHGADGGAITKKSFGAAVVDALSVVDIVRGLRWGWALGRAGRSSAEMSHQVNHGEARTYHAVAYAGPAEGPQVRAK